MPKSFHNHCCANALRKPLVEASIEVRSKPLRDAVLRLDEALQASYHYCLPAWHSPREPVTDPFPEGAGQYFQTKAMIVMQPGGSWSARHAVMELHQLAQEIRPVELDERGALRKFSDGLVTVYSWLRRDLPESVRDLVLPPAP